MRFGLDARDAEILAERVKAFDQIAGPRVGDFVEFSNGVTHRFAHDWGERGLQTTAGGSWYLGKGYVSFSGGLDPCIPRDSLTDTGDTREGDVWFFHHDLWGAGRGIDARVTFRVYRTTETFPASITPTDEEG